MLKAPSVSTYGMGMALRSAVTSGQTQLLKAQQEATTGTLYDVGLSLGARTGQTVSLRKEYDRLTVLGDMNKLVMQRMNASQSAMTGLIENSQTFLANLTGASTTLEGRAAIAEAARSSLQSATGLLNTSYNGEYIFSGVHTDIKPMDDYFAPGGKAKAALHTAFEDYFGFPTSSPQVSTIDADAMGLFLDKVSNTQFDDANWGNNWSSASDTVVKSRISPTETVDTSISGNADGFRKAMMSFAIVAEFGDIGLNESAFFKLSSHALNATTQAGSEMAISQSTLGLAQARTNDANTRITTQQKILNNSVLDLEAVDPFEAATRVNALMTQIETSYALTVKLQSMSLLNYLR